MPREVNVYFRNYRATGASVNVPQYSLEITLNWTRSDGSKASHTETALFPNVLARLSLAELREMMQDVILAEMRQRMEVEA